MLKKLQLKSWLLMLLMMLGVGNAWAETKTATFTAGTNTGETSVTIDNITVSMSTMSRTDNYRTYANTSMTVKAENANITKIEVTCTASGTSNYGPGKFSGDGYTYSGTTGTWTGTATEVSLSASAQVRITKIVVTYETSGISDDRKDPELSYEETSITVAPGTTDFVAPILTNPHSLTVTYSSSDESLARVDENFGEVTIYSQEGTVTITATFEGDEEYKEGSASYTIVIYDATLPGHSGNPYTVAQAKAAIDAAEGTTGVYVKGIISQVDSYNSSYGSITYWISEDGTTTADQFEVYSGLNLNQAKFTSKDDLQEGDEVVVYGNIKKFNASTYEFDYNNYLVYFYRKVLKDNAITGVEDSYTLELGDAGEVELTLTATATSGATVQYEVKDASTFDAGDYSFDNGNFRATGKGTIVIRAYVDKDDEYKAAEKDITINVIQGRIDPVVSDNIKTDDYNYLLKVGQSIDIRDYYTTDGEITVTTSIPQMIGIEGTVLTGLATHPLFLPEYLPTVTITSTEGIEYNAGSVAFTMVVGSAYATNGSTKAPENVSKTIFYESFDKNTDLTGGNDGDFAKGSGTYSSDNNDNEGWYISSANAALQCIKIGSSSKSGKATTPALGEAGNFTLTFKAAAWNHSKENTTLALSISGEGASLSLTEVTLSKTEWTTYTVAITGATAESTITFGAENQGSNRRFFLDEVKVFTEGEAEPTVKLNKYGYATYTNYYPLEFTADDDAEYTAWQVMGNEGNNIIFEQVTDPVSGTTGLILKGEPNATITLKYADSENYLYYNRLKAIKEPTYVVANAFYGLSGNEMKLVNTGVVKANKAIVDAAYFTNISSAKPLTFVFNGITGVERIENVTLEEAQEIFDLSGRRLAKPTRGINIVNGKKVVIK